MNAWLTQVGATLDVLAAVRSEGGRDRVQAPVTSVGKPTLDQAEARDAVRRQVMAERGVDQLTLLRMSAQDRLRAEAELNAETALRARQVRMQAPGSLLDIRV